MLENNSPLDIATDRIAYAKGAYSAVGAAAVLAVAAIWFGVPPIDTSFSFDQIIWGVAILILVLSLREFVVAVVAMAMPALLLFRFDADGVRIGGAAAPVPWPQIVSADLRTVDDKSVLRVIVRPPAPAMPWLAQHVYGLQQTAHADTLVYSIPRERIALNETDLRRGLEFILARLVSK